MHKSMQANQNSVRCLLRQPATEVVKLLKAGAVTPLQLIDEVERRWTQTQPLVNAVPIVCFEEAREKAKNLMQALHLANKYVVDFRPNNDRADSHTKKYCAFSVKDKCGETFDVENNKDTATLHAHSRTTRDEPAAEEARIKETSQNYEDLVSLAKAARSANFLWGLPIVLKDCHSLLDQPFVEGSQLFVKRRGSYSDPLVTQLENNGAIIVGKSNVPEFCLGSHTFNTVFGTTKNPFDLSRSAGGSSGGSASALASGQIWLATGSDLGGSIRIPSSFCGLVGLRPSPGVVPRDDTVSGSGVLDGLHCVNGPLARNVLDVALFLDAMKGSVGWDFTPPIDLSRSFHDAILEESAALRKDLRLLDEEEFSKSPDKVCSNLSSVSYECGDSGRSASSSTCTNANEGKITKTLKIAWSGDLGGVCVVDSETEEICRKAVEWMSRVGLGQVVEACINFENASDLFHYYRARALAGEFSEETVDAEFRSVVKPEALWNIELGHALIKGDTEKANLQDYQSAGIKNKTSPSLLYSGGAVPFTLSNGKANVSDCDTTGVRTEFILRSGERANKTNEASPCVCANAACEDISMQCRGRDAPTSEEKFRRQFTELLRDRDNFFADFDYLCTPCVLTVPFDNELRYPARINDVEFSSYIDWMELTSFMSLLGCPAVSVPCGMTKDNVPVGLQILAAPFKDYELLAFAHIYEEHHSWKDKVPRDPSAKERHPRSTERREILSSWASGTTDHSLCKSIHKVEASAFEIEKNELGGQVVAQSRPRAECSPSRRSVHRGECEPFIAKDRSGPWQSTPKQVERTVSGPRTTEEARLHHYNNGVLDKLRLPYVST